MFTSSVYCARVQHMTERALRFSQCKTITSVSRSWREFLLQLFLKYWVLCFCVPTQKVTLKWSSKILTMTISRLHTIMTSWRIFKITIAIQFLWPLFMALLRGQLERWQERGWERGDDMTQPLYMGRHETNWATGAPCYAFFTLKASETPCMDTLCTLCTRM